MLLQQTLERFQGSLVTMFSGLTLIPMAPRRHVVGVWLRAQTGTGQQAASGGCRAEQCASAWAVASDGVEAGRR
jgi:hypothetical protein